MADSFFGFDEREALDDCSDDDEDYDALNDETFGGDVLDGDWEEDHEKLSGIAELSRHKDIIQENGDLSAKIAAFILDDEPHDIHDKDQELDRLEFNKPSRPPPGFGNVTTQNHHPQEVPLPLPIFKNMCTVEEIERNLIKPQTAPSLLEDIERNLISNQQNQQLVSLHHHNSYFPAITRHHPLLNNIPKLPSIGAPFPLSGAFAHPYAALHKPQARSIPIEDQVDFRKMQASQQHQLSQVLGNSPRGPHQLSPHNNHQSALTQVLAIHPGAQDFIKPPPHYKDQPISRNFHSPIMRKEESKALRVSPPPQAPPPLLRLAPLRAPPPLPQGTPPPRVPIPLPVPHLPLPPPADEYAGLMNPKEKHWIATIQLMQISTNNPFQDDYYYMMYQHRQSGAHGRKSNVKVVRDTPALTKPTYTPLQFENSLGKLQIGSVMAPRKIIDTDVVESVESHVSAPSSKKFKQILLEIEQLFSSILAAEEVLSPLTNSMLENVNPTEIFTKAVTTLLKDDKLRTVLSIKKGKTLVLRILPHTGVSDPLAERLISVLPVAIKRDPEQALLRALPSIRHYLSTASLVSINHLTTFLSPHVISLLENKLGVSVITNMIERAEGLLSSGETDGATAWLEFVGKVVDSCSEVGPEGVERPVVGIQGAVLGRHLVRLPPSPNAHILQKAISISAT